MASTGTAFFTSVHRIADSLASRVESTAWLRHAIISCRKPAARSSKRIQTISRGGSDCSLDLTDTMRFQVDSLETNPTIPGGPSTPGNRGNRGNQSAKDLKQIKVLHPLFLHVESDLVACLPSEAPQFKLQPPEASNAQTALVPVIVKALLKLCWTATERVPRPCF